MWPFGGSPEEREEHSKKGLAVYYNLKFIYSEKATKFCEIFTLLLSYVVPVKSKVKILQNFVAFSEYMNFTVAVAKDSYCNCPCCSP